MISRPMPWQRRFIRRTWSVPPLACALVACLLGAGDVSAQEAPATADVRDNNVLEGPAVSAPAEPTLVRWSYDGTLEPLETRSEEAALSLLGLEEEALADAQGILARRQALFDRVLSRNILLAMHLDAASKAEEKRLAARLLLELLSHFEPLRHEPPLRAQLAATLPEGERARFLSLLRAYDEAYLADARFREDVAGPHRSLAEIWIARIATEFTKEAERSFARIESSGQLAFEYVMAQLELPPEQLERVRAASARFLGASPEGMTEKDYALLFLSVAAHLNEAQRAALAEIIRGF